MIFYLQFRLYPPLSYFVTLTLCKNSSKQSIFCYNIPMQNQKTHYIIVLALLFALQLVLSQIGFYTPFFTYELSLLPGILIAQFARPAHTIVLFGCFDIFVALFKGYPIDPIFIFSSAVTGLILSLLFYGVFLPRSGKTLLRFIIAAFLIVTCSYVLITAWGLSVQTGGSFVALLLGLLPNYLQVLISPLVWLAVLPFCQEIPTLKALISQASRRNKQGFWRVPFLSRR